MRHRKRINFSSPKSSVGRVPSRRSQFLAKFFEKDKRMSKEQLIEKGIYKPEAIFGNFLVNLCCTSSGIPEFLERCVAKIETMMDTVGIYRVNGDAAAVQKLRFGRKFDALDSFNLAIPECCQNLVATAVKRLL